MSKDPAFLFFTNDFVAGTQLMTDEQVGKYIRLLCQQHLSGHMTKEDMILICKSYDERIFKKFSQDDEGLFFNERLENEIEKRRNYTKSRGENRLKGAAKLLGNNANNHKKIISKSYDDHMGNGNGDINGNKKRKRSEFKKPTVQEVRNYFEENGYNPDFGETRWHYYNDADWFDSYGKPILNWKQKMRGVWFKDENKKKFELP